MAMQIAAPLSIHEREGEPGRGGKSAAPRHLATSDPGSDALCHAACIAACRCRKGLARRLHRPGIAHLRRQAELQAKVIMIRPGPCGACVASARSRLAEEVGKVGVDWLGNDIIVEAIKDPKVEGVTCHVSYFDRGVIDRLQKGNWFEDLPIPPSPAARPGRSPSATST